MTEKKESFEQVLVMLSENVDALKKGGLPLEESLKLYAKGVSLYKLGENILNNAERRIEEILGDDGIQKLNT